MLLCLFIAALWSPVGKGLTSWSSFVMFYCVSVTFQCGILGQVWYVLIVLIPDLCNLFYFDVEKRCVIPYGEIPYMERLTTLHKGAPMIRFHNHKNTQRSNLYQQCWF